MRIFKQSAQDKLRKAEAIIKNNYQGLADDAHIEPVYGGASTREYYRVFMPRVPINNTGILMLMEKPFNVDKSDYYQVSELLRKLNLPVPVIYQDFSRQGALLLQDVGQIHLHDLVNGSPEDTVLVESLYKQAIDHLITLQTRASRYSDGVKAFQRAFDEKKLGWEMNYTLKHFVKGFADYTFTSDEKKTYNTFIKQLCQQIAALPRTFCHRDYHSLNLMLWMEKLYILDFQDARMGPCLYDMVSLLGDSYFDMGNSMRYTLLNYFAEKHPDYDQNQMKEVYEEFTLIALQRHLKHLGTFAALHAKGYDEAIKNVPLTLTYLRENLSKFEELQQSAAVLSRIFDASLAKYHTLDLE